MQYFDPSKYGEIFPHVEKILQCGVYTRSYQSNITEWSKGVYDILGLDNCEMAPDPNYFYNRICEEDKQRIVEVAKKSAENKETYEIEFSITDAKGVQKRLYAENRMVFDENNEIIEYTGILKDITEVYNTRIELLNKIYALNKSNESLQEFAYVASHDLQEPVRKILTFVERASSKYGSTFNQDLALYCSKIETSAYKMQTLLNDLLDFSRLSKTPVDIEKVNLKEIINNVIDELDVLIEGKDVEIVNDTKHWVAAFPGQFQQLFTNLISNAIKFKCNDRPCRIKITSSEIDPLNYKMFPLALNQKYISVTVDDNGIGFDQVYSEKIFQVFNRLHGKAEYKGSGIGLSICKRIAENHQGFIYAVGRKDEGATFTVILPEQQN